ncbi:MAG: double zinc ribbon domain-containing protein [Lachnospirales bacterium]
MYCKYCGTENDTTSTICKECFKPTLEGKKYCQKCGSKVFLSTKICSTCGAKQTINLRSKANSSTEIYNKENDSSIKLLLTIIFAILLILSFFFLVIFLVKGELFQYSKYGIYALLSFLCALFFGIFSIFFKST